MRKRYIMLLSFLLLGMAYSVYAQIATSCIPNPSQP